MHKKSSRNYLTENSSGNFPSIFTFFYLQKLALEVLQDGIAGPAKYCCLI